MSDIDELRPVDTDTIPPDLDDQTVSSEDYHSIKGENDNFEAVSGCGEFLTGPKINQIQTNKTS